MINWYEVQSSNIKRLGYDPDTNTAYAEFKSKDGSILAVWEYSGVSESLFEAWAAADSIGGFFHSFVKGKFDGVKIA